MKRELHFKLTDKNTSMFIRQKATPIRMPAISAICPSPLSVVIIHPSNSCLSCLISSLIVLPFQFVNHALYFLFIEKLDETADYWYMIPDDGVAFMSLL